jgi:predicted phage terminase large subunit-like protein
MQLESNSKNSSAYLLGLQRLIDGLKGGDGDDTPDYRQAYEDFTDYKQLIHKRYRRALHLDKLDALLTRVALYVESKGTHPDGIRNLIVSMPRRYGKTLSVGILFPTWYLGRNPDHRVMMASYGASLVEKTSRKARNIIKSPRYQSIFGHALSADSASVSSWELDGHEGGMDAMGIMGGATGKGWHVLIVDDALKNREEAESETIRDKVWDELEDSFFNGADVPYAARIIFATRWHPDDPIGRLLLREPDDWVNFKLPAIAGDDDALGRVAGSALWDYKHTIEQLRELEIKIPPYSWSSLWQQEPTPGEGGFFKRAWFTVVSQPPEIVFAARYWDLAMSDKPTADFTVGLKIGLGVDGHYYILDVVRKRVDWGELVDFMAGVMLADGPAVSQGVEKAGYMTRAVGDLNADHRLHGYSVMGYEVDRAKHIRALPVQGKFQAGKIALVRAHWNDSYVDEMCAFTPKGAVHDDQVDATSGAWVMMDGQAMMEGYTSW